MGKINKPRHGSLAMRPRKRAESQMPPVNFWPKSAEKRVLGFAGYKAGMTHIGVIEDRANPNKGNEVFAPVTVVEVPPMVVFAVRGYSHRQVFGDMLAKDENVLKPLGMGGPKKSVELKADGLSDVCVLAYAQASKAGLPKKSAEPMELALGGKDVAEKLEYAKSLLGKELKFSDVFKPGEYVDSISVTKGKGWQGAVKRFGISVQRRKATGKRRHVGSLGPWHPSYVMYTVPMAGQMGYHKRTSLNNRIMKIGSDPKEVNPNGGFMHYGMVQGDYVIIKGSIGGPAKRLVRFRKATRGPSAVKAPEVRYVSTESKQ
jgi:large subunit ribosomal protein L3